LRHLHPKPAESDLDELYRGLTLPTGGPDRDGWVALCMVSSLDGAVALDGVSGGLGGDADLLALSRLRASNDVSLVGAGTVRDERYGPLRGSAARREDRAARGLRPVPRLAIVSRSGALDPELPVFADPEHPPLVLTSDAADQRRLARLEDRAELHVFPDGQLGGGVVVEHLVSLGLPRILCEGGPTLNQALLTEDRIDEVFLTLAPTLVGGSAARIVAGRAEAPRGFELVSVFEHAGDLLLRHRRGTHRP
jgi:riboflavin biosynthesis pyrimidine reductase